MADYRAILDAIDAAIERGVSGPVQIRGADGRMMTYHSLPDLIAARKHYTALAAGQRRTPIGTLKLRPGSARL